MLFAQIFKIFSDIQARTPDFSRPFTPHVTTFLPDRNFTWKAPWEAVLSLFASSSLSLLLDVLESFCTLFFFVLLEKKVKK